MFLLIFVSSLVLTLIIFVIGLVGFTSPLWLGKTYYFDNEGRVSAPWLFGWIVYLCVVGLGGFWVMTFIHWCTRGRDDEWTNYW